jgi:hypothetical protein
VCVCVCVSINAPNNLQLYTPLIRRTNGQKLETLEQSNAVLHVGGHLREMYFHTAVVELNMLYVAHELSDLLFYVTLLRLDRDQLNVC